MIAVTPKADKETVVEELNQFFKEHVSTEKKFTDAVRDHFGKNLMWEIFSNHGIDVAINDDGIVQFRVLTRMGFTQLHDTYLKAKYGLTLDSLVTHDRDTGARKTPMSSTGIDRSIENILTQDLRTTVVFALASFSKRSFNPTKTPPSSRSSMS